MLSPETERVSRGSTACGSSLCNTLDDVLVRGVQEEPAVLKDIESTVRYISRKTGVVRENYCCCVPLFIDENSREVTADF